jgi:hypothetical protein
MLLPGINLSRSARTIASNASVAPPVINAWLLIGARGGLQTDSSTTGTTPGSTARPAISRRIFPTAR